MKRIINRIRKNRQKSNLMEKDMNDPLPKKINYKDFKVIAERFGNNQLTVLEISAIFRRQQGLDNPTFGSFIKVIERAADVARHKKTRKIEETTRPGFFN